MLTQQYLEERSMSMNTFLATTSQGLARASQSASGEWSVEFLLNDQDVRCLAADPLNPRVIYAGTQGQGVLRSEDGGKTWRSVGLAGQIVKALAISRTQPGTIYAGTKPALLFVSRDGGRSWTELASFRRIRSRWFWFSPAEKPYSAYVQAIALSPKDPNIIVVGIEFGAMVQSLDAGQSWTGHRRGRCAIATRSPSMSPMATGCMKVVVVEQVSLSAGMRARPGNSQRTVLPGTMVGWWLPTRPVLKFGMPRLLPVRSKRTARTMLKPLLSARLGAHPGSH